MTQCPDCGGTDFTIDETIGHKADLDEDGELTVYRAGFYNSINSIECSKCGHQLKEEDFKQINF